MPLKKLYFIALIPPEPVYGDVLKWKNFFAENFNSKAALRSPPHLTLHMPFKWREDNEQTIEQTLERVASVHQSFDVFLNGFGSFNMKTIFIDVDLNDALFRLQADLKNEMKRSLNIFNAEHKNGTFHPHITLAFRDLKKTAFSEAWKQFENKDYKKNFDVNEIVLLKHNGKFWEISKAIALSKDGFDST